MNTQTSRGSILPEPPSGRPITREDLQAFKAEVIKEILLGLKVPIHDQPQSPPKKWLKTYEVRKLLGIRAPTMKTNPSVLSSLSL